MTSTETSTHSTTASSTPTTTGTTESTTTATTESSTTMTSTETSTPSTTGSSTPTTTGTTGIYSASSNMFASWYSIMMIIIGIAVGIYGVNFGWKRFSTHRATISTPTHVDLEEGGAEPYDNKNYINDILHTVPDANADAYTDIVLGTLVLNLNTVNGNSDDDVSNYSWPSVSDLDLSDNESSANQREPFYTTVIPRNERQTL